MPASLRRRPCRPIRLVAVLVLGACRAKSAPSPVASLPMPQPSFECAYETRATTCELLSFGTPSQSTGAVRIEATFRTPELRSPCVAQVTVSSDALELARARWQSGSVPCRVQFLVRGACPPVPMCEVEVPREWAVAPPLWVSPLPIVPANTRAAHVRRRTR